MSSAILVDRGANAIELKRYLGMHSTDLADIRILDKADLASGQIQDAGIRYLFSTWNMPVLSEKEVADFFPDLEAVFYAAGDTNYFSEPYENRGVRVFSAQYENSIPVAEFVLAQVLLANKGYFQAREQYKHGFWRWGYRKARALSLGMPGNLEVTVGIIGFGTIGSLLAELLRPFDMKVVVYDPFVDDSRVQGLGAGKVGLEELFQTSDVISNHLPDVPETRGMLDHQLFSQMKPMATFINTGRGRQVDEKGLVRAMRKSPFRTALLDVTYREPPNPFSSLRRVRNIFLSPHVAGSQGNEINRLYRAILSKFIAYQEG